MFYALVRPFAIPFVRFFPNVSSCTSFLFYINPFNYSRKTLFCSPLREDIMQEREEIKLKCKMEKNKFENVLIQTS
jgi:hypothetical protein